MRVMRQTLLAAVMLFAVIPALAQEAATPLPTLIPNLPIMTATPVLTSNTVTSNAVTINANTTMALPSAARLSGLRAVWQQMNRCSAAALTIQLSYFQWAGTYDDAIRALNPNMEDVAVRIEEMAAYARTQGLGAVERTGGTVDLLKRFVAAGFPVLVENSYFEGAGGFNDWMGHNRVIMGYDDAQGVLFSYDSLLGNGADGLGRPIPYNEMDARWRPFNRDYLVLYQPEDSAQVEAILGEQWDINANAEWTLAMSQSEIDLGVQDSFTYFNMGSSLTTLDRYEEAAAAFDTARQTGLPWRMLWYQYGPFDAYMAVGRYDDVLTLVQGVIATTPGVEEMYYYAGLAYEAQGNMERATSNFEVAVWRNSGFLAASEALARVQNVSLPATGTGA